MSLKMKQTSRLNSLEENLCKCLLKTIHKCPFHLAQEQNEDKSFTSETPEQGEAECETLRIEFKMSSSRTSLLIQDYLEFKAARTIQRFVRGWLYCCLYKRKRWAAIVIQAEWRRFYCQRLYFKKLEEELQQRIEQHFFRAAQKIQALWRGWWVRHYVHDLTHLKRVQILAGEDLLYCVAFKLHHLLRTHQIPGVYSLRNSNALSKVEQLLASLRFKAFNQQTQKAMRHRCRERRNAEKQHIKSAFGTKVPFAKNQINSSTKQKCSILLNAKDADARMAKIIQMYEEENRKMAQPQVLRRMKFASYNQPLSNIPPSETSSFCGDVVKSMKKWKIITEKNLSVDSSIFKKPENVENFLNEVGSQLSLVQQNRNCGSKFLKDPLKSQSNYADNKAASSSITIMDKNQNSTADGNGVRSIAYTASECSIISSEVFTWDKEKSSSKDLDSCLGNTSNEDLI